MHRSEESELTERAHLEADTECEPLWDALRRYVARNWREGGEE